MKWRRVPCSSLFFPSSLEVHGGLQTDIEVESVIPRDMFIIMMTMLQVPRQCPSSTNQAQDQQTKPEAGEHNKSPSWKGAEEHRRKTFPSCGAESVPRRAGSDAGRCRDGMPCVAIRPCKPGDAGRARRGRGSTARARRRSGRQPIGGRA